MLRLSRTSTIRSACGKVDVDQVADGLGQVERGALLGHRDAALPQVRGAPQEEVGACRGVRTRCRTRAGGRGSGQRRRGRRRAVPCSLVEADQRPGRVGRAGIDVEDVLHAGDEGGILLGGMHHPSSPRLEHRFFERGAHRFAADGRDDLGLDQPGGQQPQRPACCPAGGRQQAKAIRCASAAPRVCADTPVGRPSLAGSSRPSVGPTRPHPGHCALPDLQRRGDRRVGPGADRPARSALSRMRACVWVRAGAAPPASRARTWGPARLGTKTNDVLLARHGGTPPRVGQSCPPDQAAYSSHGNIALDGIRCGISDRIAVSRLIAAQFPEWAALPVRAGRVRRWDNRTSISASG